MEDGKTNIIENESQHFGQTQKEWIINFCTIILISSLLGGICGIVMVGFNFLLIGFKFGFSFLPFFIGPVIAGGLTSLLVKWGYKKNLFRIMGTGASDFIEEVTSPELGYNRVPILLGKTAATSWTFGSGMVCGKEGPGLLIGANLGHILANKFSRSNLDLDDYYYIGASACTSAILKAPISGALFIGELPFLNNLRYRSLLPSIFASSIAYLIFCSFFGFTPFIQTDLTVIERINYITLFPLLIFFGVFIGIFVFILVAFMNKWMESIKGYFRGKQGFWLLPLIGGALYSVFLLLTIPFMNTNYHGAILGPDSDFLSFIISNIKQFTWYILLILVLLFVIAIIFSIGFYNSAGLILPLMLFGALVGGLFGVVFYPEHPELFVLLGISAVLGASINNPITAIIIIVEMTWEPFLFIPAGIVTLIAYIISGPKTIIPGQMEVKVEPILHKSM